MWQRNAFLFERLITHHSTSMPFLTTHLQSSSSCLKWSTREFQIYLVYNKEEFNKVKSIYEWALKDSGHFSSVSYNKRNFQNARRNRKRKVIWFDPPYSQNMKTNIGKLFVKLVRKHFLKNSKHHKIFNLNTLKLSFCWKHHQIT